MAKVEIFDPSMCCSTGVCGTDVDPTLSRFAADIEWLATQGVVVQRAALAQEPGKFAANVAVRNALVINGTGVLPAVVVDGVLKSTGAYPAREEMAGWGLSRVSWNLSGGPPPDTARGVGVGHPPRHHQEGDHRDQQVPEEHAKDEFRTGARRAR